MPCPNAALLPVNNGFRVEHLLLINIARTVIVPHYEGKQKLRWNVSAKQACGCTMGSNAIGNIKMRLERSVLQPSYEMRVDQEALQLRQPARIVSVRPGLGGLDARSCEIRSISANQAWIALLTTIGLPNHYYLEIDGLLSRIGCAERHRRPDRVCVMFLTPLRSYQLERLAAIAQPAHTGTWLLQ